MSQPPTFSEQRYCKSCKVRSFAFATKNQICCPLCKSPLTEIIPVFSIEYLNHTRTEHPEKAIRSLMGLNGQSEPS